MSGFDERSGVGQFYANAGKNRNIDPRRTRKRKDTFADQLLQGKIRHCESRAMGDENGLDQTNTAAHKVHKKSPLGSGLSFQIVDRGLLARANSTSQTGVVAAIFAVPKWAAIENSLTKSFDLFCTAGRSVGRNESISLVWHEILIVAVLKDRFENVINLFTR